MDTGTTIDHWRQAPRLAGEHVSLEPLHPEHAEGLRSALHDGELWCCWYTNVPKPEEAEAYVAAALEMQGQGRALAFAVRAASGDLVGSTRFYALDPAVPRLSIGYTWYAKRAQRTGINTEAKLLLLEHAFETLGCIAVAFETSWFNSASRAAIARLGARQDGVLRNHMRHGDGTARDTVVFSILDNEWPSVRRNLQYKLEQHRHG